jgi:hypothetical protein
MHDISNTWGGRREKIDTDQYGGWYHFLLGISGVNCTGTFNSSGKGDRTSVNVDAIAGCSISRVISVKPKRFCKNIRRFVSSRNVRYIENLFLIVLPQHIITVLQFRIHQLLKWDSVQYNVH